MQALPERAQPAMARSWLFIPGDRPDRFDRAATSGADLVVVDLEDAVAPAARPAARSNVARWLEGGGRGCVRVNPVRSSSFADDVAALRGRPGLVAVIVPKAEDAEELGRVSDALTVPVVALVETALGVHRVHATAAARGVQRLAFGAVDLSADLGCTEDGPTAQHARSVVVLASRVAGLPGPLDGVTTQLDDPERAGADATAARRAGFAGKLCVHPHQVGPVNDAMSPTPAQLAGALRLLDAAAAAPEVGAVRVDGAMVDEAVLARAREVVRRARSFDVGAEPAG